MGSDRIISKGNSKGTIGTDHENSPEIIGNDHMGIVGNDSKEIIRDDLLGQYKVYVVSPAVKRGARCRSYRFGVASIISKRSIIDKVQ
jgi:hypothetical protein